MKRDSLILLIIAASLTSCSTTRKVNKQTVAVDSTVYQENAMLRESVNEMSKTIEKLSTDSSSQVVIFESSGATIDSIWLDGDSLKFTLNDSTYTQYYKSFKAPSVPKKPNKAEFYPDGKLKSAEGQIKSIITKANKAESIKDSLQVRVWALEDSTAKLQASKKVETMVKTIEVKRRNWWWLWALIGGAITLIIRNNWRSWAFRLFGWKGKTKPNDTT